MPVIESSISAIFPSSLESQPPVDEAIPGIRLIAGFLLGPSRINQCGIGEPPDRALSILVKCLGPELIAITREGCNVDFATTDGPETAVAGFITELGVRIDAASEDTLARRFDNVPAIGWPVPVSCAGQKGLDAGNFSAGDGIELSDLDDPYATRKMWKT